MIRFFKKLKKSEKHVIHIGNSTFCKMFKLEDWVYSGPDDMHFPYDLKEEIRNWLVDCLGEEGSNWSLRRTDRCPYSDDGFITYIEFLSEENLAFFVLTWA